MWELFFSLHLLCTFVFVYCSNTSRFYVSLCLCMPPLFSSSPYPILHSCLSPSSFCKYLHQEFKKLLLVWKWHMTSEPHNVLISRALGCRCLGVATWALLLFSSTLPVTWIPLGLCCVRELAGFGEARFWCMCLVCFFPGSLKSIWTSGWFILVVWECNLPLHHLLHAHWDWQVETCSHRH